MDEHTLTTSISRIRSKIEADGENYIKTVYGMGYQWMGGEKEMKLNRLSVKRLCLLIGPGRLLSSWQFTHHVLCPDW